LASYSDTRVELAREERGFEAYPEHRIVIHPGYYRIPDVCVKAIP
jgi:hypothetical protein